MTTEVIGRSVQLANVMASEALPNEPATVAPLGSHQHGPGAQRSGQHHPTRGNTKVTA
jgi:hypothetical protein